MVKIASSLCDFRNGQASPPYNLYDAPLLTCLVENVSTFFEAAILRFHTFVVVRISYMRIHVSFDEEAFCVLSR